MHALIGAGVRDVSAAKGCSWSPRMCHARKAEAYEAKRVRRLRGSQAPLFLGGTVRRNSQSVKAPRRCVGGQTLSDAPLRQAWR